MKEYRLIGFENRLLNREDFNDDKKDAGEIGAGIAVTAFYEIIPAGAPGRAVPADELRYQTSGLSAAARANELLTVKLRYKKPDEDTSKLLSYVVRDSGQGFNQASADFRFASSVALFGMLLRQSPNTGRATLSDVIAYAAPTLGHDLTGERVEFLTLVRKAREIQRLLLEQTTQERQGGQTSTNNEQAGREILRSLLQWDKNLTDDPCVTFRFFRADQNGYEFETEHCKTHKKQRFTSE